MEATTLQQNGYHVSIICPQANGYDRAYEVIESIHIYRHPLPPEISSVYGYLREYAWAVMGQFRLAFKIWRKRRFDLIHICNPPDLLFLVAGWFKLLHGVRVIFDHHDLAPEMYLAKYNRKDFFYYALLQCERWTYAIADWVISTNESHQEVALNRGKKKPSQVFVVRSAPDMSRFYALSSSQDYHNGKSVLIGYMGVMGEPEGIDYLLRVIHYLVYEKQRCDMHFILIGDGPAFTSLQDLAKQLQIEPYVEFTGFKTGKELLERLSSCDICVEPSPFSTYNENCTMNKILEYMAIGKPIVQFDLREGRRSAATASLYVTPNDEIEFAEKILALVESPELRRKLGNEGRRRMRDVLEWKHQAPKLLELYHQAFESGRVSLSQSKQPALERKGQ